MKKTADLGSSGEESGGAGLPVPDDFEKDLKILADEERALGIDEEDDDEEEGNGADADEGEFEGEDSGEEGSKRLWPKPLTIPFKEIERAGDDAFRDLNGPLKEEAEWLDANRPMTRGECRSGMRPCPFMLCRHHLYLDILRTGALKFNYPGVELDELPFTCALDIADGGPRVLEEVGIVLNMTRERLRQIEAHAAMRIRETLDDPRRRRGDTYIPWSDEDEEVDSEENGNGTGEAGLSRVDVIGSKGESTKKKDDPNTGFDLGLDFTL